MGLKDWLFGKAPPLPSPPLPSPPPPPRYDPSVVQCRWCSQKFPGFLPSCPFQREQFCRDGRAREDEHIRYFTSCLNKRGPEFTEEYRRWAREEIAKFDRPTFNVVPGAPPFPSGPALNRGAFESTLRAMVDQGLELGDCRHVFVSALDMLLQAGPYAPRDGLEVMRAELFRAAGISAEIPYVSKFLTEDVDIADRGRGEMIHSQLVGVCFTKGAARVNLPSPYDHLYFYYARVANKENLSLQAAAELSAKQKAKAPPSPPAAPPPPPPKLMADIEELLDAGLDGEELKRELQRRRGKPSGPPPTTIDPP